MLRDARKHLNPKPKTLNLRDARKHRPSRTWTACSKPTGAYTLHPTPETACSRPTVAPSVFLAGLQLLPLCSFLFCSLCAPFRFLCLPSALATSEGNVTATGH